MPKQWTANQFYIFMILRQRATRSQNGVLTVFIDLPDAILECATERQHKAVCVVPLENKPASVTTLNRFSACQYLTLRSLGLNLACITSTVGKCVCMYNCISPSPYILTLALGSI